MPVHFDMLPASKDSLPSLIGYFAIYYWIVGHVSNMFVFSPLFGIG